jgi:hypothetical protein
VVRKKISAYNLLEFIKKIVCFIDEQIYFENLFTTYVLIKILEEQNIDKQQICKIIIQYFFNNIEKSLVLNCNKNNDVLKELKLLFQLNDKSTNLAYSNFMQLAQFFYSQVLPLTSFFMAGVTTQSINKVFEFKTGFNVNVLTGFDNKLKADFQKILNRESFWLDLFYLEIRISELFVHYCKLEIEYSKALESLAQATINLLNFTGYITINHVNSVSNMAQLLAEFMGFSEEEIFQIKVAGLLHDIGKVVVPKEILNYPGKLNQEQLKMIRVHSYYTYQFLRILDPPEIILSAAYHHEKLDGTGYPFHLDKSKIPLSSQIIAVADIYSALNEDRPYRKKLPENEIKLILKEMVANKSLNSEIVDLISKIKKEV